MFIRKLNTHSNNNYLFILHAHLNCRHKLLAALEQRMYKKELLWGLFILLNKRWKIKVENSYSRACRALTSFFSSITFGTELI